MIAVETEPKRYGVSGFTIPGHYRKPANDATAFPHEIPLPYPAIEALPSYVARIASNDLSHGVRHYNGSIARHGKRVFMAYRVESFSAVSSVGLCELDSTFNVVADSMLNPSVTNPETQIEDPHMASVGGKLVVVVSNVVRGFPQVCQQRLFEIDPDDLAISSEIKASFGNVHGIEKNWTPFELPDGSLGMVYKQRPRMVINVETKQGWATPEAKFGPAESSLSGRTGPLRVSEGHDLEFVGGHVKFQTRGTRYWFGAILFESKEPFKIVRATSEPLVWASEASPTIFNPLPRGGHPVCILPAGAMLDSGYVYVSCGVNDSYNVILRFNVSKLIEEMGLI